MSHPASSATVSSATGLLLGVLAHSPNVDAFLDEVVRLAAEVVTPVAACGITMDRDGRPFTVSSSNEVASQVDEIQYGADEGPCLDAFRLGIVIQIDELAREQRWPRYRPHAAGHGIVSSLSIPLVVDGRPVAALNLYSTERGAFAGPQRQHAEAFSAQCAAALALTLRQVRQEQLQHQLGEAMASRSIIDQAIGILMGQQRCNATTAFELLREASQHRNRKLRDVAADIIANVTGQPPRPATEFRPSPTP